MTDTMSVRAMPASVTMASMLRQTTAACSAMSVGTVPSGAIGTTPAVCSIAEPASDSTPWA
ncbi:MAG: hypothetical protein R2749_09710 [Acidimicrobiales bacterium]